MNNTISWSIPFAKNRFNRSIAIWSEKVYSSIPAEITPKKTIERVWALGVPPLTIRGLFCSELGLLHFPLCPACADLVVTILRAVCHDNKTKNIGIYTPSSKIAGIEKRIRSGRSYTHAWCQLTLPSMAIESPHRISCCRITDAPPARIHFILSSYSLHAILRNSQNYKQG